MIQGLAPLTSFRVVWGDISEPGPGGLRCRVLVALGLDVHQQVVKKKKNNNNLYFKKHELLVLDVAFCFGCRWGLVFCSAASSPAQP